MSQYTLSWSERLLVAIVPRLLKVLSWTWRVELIDPHHVVRSPELFAHWHGDMYALLGCFGGSDAAIMVSHSKDGELFSQVVHRLGMSTVRGSSSKGGARALKSLIDQLKAARFRVGLAGDGPRGPVYRLKPGILQLSQFSGRRVVPVAIAARRSLGFGRAWDRSFLPLPFTRLVAIFGEPRSVPRRIPDEDFEALRERIEAALREQKVEAERRCGRDYDLDLVVPRRERASSS